MCKIVVVAQEGLNVFLHFAWLIQSFLNFEVFDTILPYKKTVRVYSRNILCNDCPPDLYHMSASIVCHTS